MENHRRKPRPPLITRLITFGAYFTRPMILGVRALVIDADNRVLLVRHTYVGGYWLPGGGVERGETLLQTLEKELREEGNLEFARDDAHLHGVYLNDQACSYDHEALFVLRRFQRREPFAPTWEIADSRFHPMDALPPEALPSVRSRIAEVCHGAPRSAYW